MKRLRRCLSVQFQRSTCAVSPVSLPTCVSCSSGITSWYIFQKSVKQCPLRYSSGILFHSSRHVFLLRSPTARATICRVFLQRAIHIHTLFTFLNTNGHNSSNSRIVAFGSSGSGAINVSLKGGSLAAFFSANLSPCCVLLQMSLSALSNCYALDRIGEPLHGAPPYIHLVQDPRDFASCMICSDIFAFHSKHVHYAPNPRSHSVGSRSWLWSSPWWNSPFSLVSKTFPVALSLQFTTSSSQGNPLPAKKDILAAQVDG